MNTRAEQQTERMDAKVHQEACDGPRSHGSVPHPWPLAHAQGFKGVFGAFPSVHAADAHRSCDLMATCSLPNTYNSGHVEVSHAAHAFSQRCETTLSLFTWLSAVSRSILQRKMWDHSHQLCVMSHYKVQCVTGTPEHRSTETHSNTSLHRHPTATPP
jgi:hypothetical protein